MPTTAQDRIRRGPFGALLILLSLFLSSGTAAAAGSDLGQPATRMGPGRNPATVALLPPPIRHSPDEDAGSDGAESGPPSAPGLVTLSLRARPAAGPSFVDEAAPARPAKASYQARAPPAA